MPDKFFRSVLPGEPRELPKIDTSVAHIARVYDYWLGGKDNFAIDREVGQKALQAHPETVLSVQANRRFLARSVRHLAAAEGIRQFLDVGTGLPVGEQHPRGGAGRRPEARVVYVDNDPIVLAHARALLTSSPQGETAYLDADIKDTDEILAGAAQVLDFSQPVGVMLVAVLHMLRDEEDPQARRGPADGGRPGRQLPGDLAPGQRHPAGGDGRDGPPPQPGDDPAGHHAQPRPGHRLLRRADLLDPGVVLTHQWRPDDAAEAATPGVLWAGAARKD